MALNDSTGFLSASVYGDGSGNFLNAWISDSAGSIWQFPLGQVNHKGWAEMSASLVPSGPWPNAPISRPDLEELIPPLYLYALVLDGVHEGSDNSGTIYIDQLAVSDSSLPIVASVPAATQPAQTETAIAEVENPEVENTEVENTEAEDAAVAVPAGLSGRIAYATFNGGGMDTYVVDLATQRILTTLPNKRQPDIAGQLLAVNGQGGGHDDIYRMSATGENQRAMTLHPEDAFPQWSPSTASLAFVSTLQGDGKWRLYWQVDAGDRAEAPPLAYSGRELFARYPVYLDNWRIAYQGCNTWEGASSCGIYMADTNGGKPNQVTQLADDVPTGNLSSQILFMSKRSGNWDIYVVNWDGSGLRQLTTDPAIDILATGGPGYSHIAFVSNRSGVWAVHVMNLDGSGQRKLFDMVGGYGSGEFDFVNERISWGPN